MTSDNWYPLSVREAGAVSAYDVLDEHVPAHLFHSLKGWILSHFLVVGREPEREVLELIELRLKKPLKWVSGSVQGALKHLLDVQFHEAEGKLLLDAIDLALHTVAYEEDDLEKLEQSLNLGGSVWTVRPTGRCLSRRVSRTATDAAALVMSTGSRAAKLLEDAWQHVYGRNPNASEGYHLAVRSVEMVVCPVVIPDARPGTLGKAIKALKDAPPGKFTTVFTQLETSDPLLAVRQLMELLWKQHIDRHGTADDGVPLAVSLAEAEAALFAAVTLVQWFDRGVVRMA